MSRIPTSATGSNPSRKEQATANRAAIASVRVPAAITIAAAAFAAATVGVSSAQAASSEKKFTFYAVATRARFIDHADDRARGQARNPFNADIKAVAPASKAKEQGNGPFPGDDEMYSFKVYSDPSLKKNVGTADYTCAFNFAQHALCEASFELGGGNLFAAGPVDFSSTDFTLAVTGGTGKYLGARGEVGEGSATQHEARDQHRLEFTLE